jgi:catechol 2,3-dioxygenase-like lactoylglutathione lyase family enzyme
LSFLGFSVGAPFFYAAAHTRLTVNINELNGVAFNIWEAKPELRGHPFEIYKPGLHHVAFNVATHEQVDEIAQLVRGLGAEILDGPGEFPFADGGYYAVYVRGPDAMKLEFVHMPEAERRAGELEQLVQEARAARAQRGRDLTPVSTAFRRRTSIVRRPRGQRRATREERCDRRFGYAAPCGPAP